MSRHDVAAGQMRSRSDGWWYAKGRCRLPSNGWTSAWHPWEWRSTYARRPEQPGHRKQFAVDRHDIHLSALQYHPVRTGGAICRPCAREHPDVRQHPCFANPERTVRPSDIDPTRSVALYADAPEIQGNFYPRRSERRGPPACQPSIKLLLLSRKLNKMKLTLVPGD